MKINDVLLEFAPGSGGDDGGDDPYKYPQPEHYNRSIDFFGRFEADHFDDEEFDKATGVFKGYWDDAEGRVQIGYFKFDDPAATGSDDPGMGWYYEPQNESVRKYRSQGSEQQLDEILPALAAGAGALTRGAAAVGRMAAPTLRKVPGAVKTVGQAISRVPGAVEKVAIQGLELLNDKVPGGIFNPDGSLKGSQYLTKYLSPQEIQQAQQHQKQGVAEGLNEFAPGSGSGESGRWYTDDQMTDIVGDGWYEDLDVSGNVPKDYMIQQAQAWLDDQGYSVQVLNAKLNDDDMDWYIEGNFHNPGFAKKGMAEATGDEDYGPELDALKKEFGKFTTHYDRMDQDPDYAAQWRKQNTDRLNREVPDDEDTIGAAADDMAHDMGDDDNVREGKPREKEADYGDDYQDMVARVKKLAGMGPLKTVYDPQKRVYKNVPTAVQPKKEQR
jgi:hypothetical protein